MHDVTIIGAGPAGVSAALWCDALGLDALVLEQAEIIGGQLNRVHNRIENYLGVKTANGAEFIERFSSDVSDADFDLWTNVAIDSIDLNAKRVSLRSGEQIQSIAIVIATGVRRRTLGIPGEQEFVGRGLIESGARDRDQLKGQDVCVIGGGDAAVENALLLSDVCATVSLIHRGKRLRARREMSEQLQTNHCVTVFTESVVTRILGEREVEAVEVLRKGGLKPFQIAVKGVLIRIGVEPNTELVRGQVDLNEQGYIITNSEHETNVPMAFAIGDVSNPLAPTISSAVGAGATTAKVIATRLNARA
ncbi:MAG TPA: NAD(P)/FAD-dependent oxidoreductase [Pyrinomonadaceae bacterium]